MRVLLVGATGVVGSAALRQFLDSGAEVVALSRRRPELIAAAGFTHLSLDLLDRAAVAAALAQAGTFSHVVYAALHEQPGLIAGWTDPEQIANNEAMLRNCLDPLVSTSPALQHISLLQGTKAYGYHVARMRVPAKERQPRVLHENFYWNQQDYLLEMTARHGWSYTIFRPQFIFGDASGVAMNLIPVIGAYAALCRELGEPFSFPGGRSYVAEAVDSRLLARALLWAATAPGARDEIFNITNGDVFEWRDLWPSFAQTLGVDVGPDQPRSLAAWLPAQQKAWAALAGRHGLREPDLVRLLGQSHHYADNAFAWTAEGQPLDSREQPVLLSTIKLRQAGFADCVDTEEMFGYWLRRLQNQAIVPPR